ncbi:nucleotidyltransferase family protein [Hyphococcus sp.]|uniref:nucleotidyltransferase family protein n=1 Tax=Hyphococcus sp. TaxID=2038636 RepID=UPI0035C6D342
MDEPDLLRIAMDVPENELLLEKLPELNLPQCYLTAGCLFQPVWNIQAGQAPDWGIRDFDVFYFDDRDLSWGAEDQVIEQACDLLGPLSSRVEIRNQARVHLWYEQRFGSPVTSLTSSKAGIDRFLIACTCVGVDIGSREVYAPNGLDDLEKGVLRRNPMAPAADLFGAKAQSYRDRWPWLTIAD